MATGLPFCWNCPDHEGCSQGVPCDVAQQFASERTFVVNDDVFVSISFNNYPRDQLDVLYNFAKSLGVAHFNISVNPAIYDEEEIEEETNRA